MVNSSASDAAYSSDDDASYDLIDAKGVQQDLKQLGDVLADFQTSLQHTVTRIVEEKLKSFDVRPPLPVIERQEVNVEDSLEKEDEDEDNDDVSGAEECEENQEQETEKIENQEVSNNVNVEQGVSNKVSAKQILGSIVDTLGEKAKSNKRTTSALIIVALAVLAASYYFQKPNVSPPVSLAEEMAGRRMLKSVYDNYLGFWLGGDLHIRSGPSKCDIKRWYIHEHQGKVILQSWKEYPKVISARSEGKIEFADRIEEESMWTPLKHADGQWSLRSSHGTFLRFKPDGGVTLQSHCRRDEQFLLEAW